MKTAVKIGIAIMMALLLLAGALWFLVYGCQSDWCRVVPVNVKPVFGPTESVGNSTDLPLMLPDGVAIEEFVSGEDIVSPRVLRFASDGALWASDPDAGKVVRMWIDEGEVKSVQAMYERLNRPHGLAFDPETPQVLYIAEEDRVIAYSTSLDFTPDPEFVVALPDDGGHWSRTIGFSPEGELFISVGSSCNVCNEKDERRAAILRYDEQSGEAEVYASGLRNSVFFIWDSWGRMVATDMGRDLLGDDTPPDEVNIIRKGGDYGWPICYGKNIHDSEFDTNVYIRNPCEDAEPSFIDIQAHSAPLGIAQIPADSAWPEAWWGDYIVSYHGSWNRSVPTGYKLVRMVMSEGGTYERTEDFITGWLRPDGSSIGRPVDVVAGPDGALYVSDDKRGVIYRIWPEGE